MLYLHLIVYHHFDGIYFALHSVVCPIVKYLVIGSYFMNCFALNILIFKYITYLNERYDTTIFD